MPCRAVQQHDRGWHYHRMHRRYRSLGVAGARWLKPSQYRVELIMSDRETLMGTLTMGTLTPDEDPDEDPDGDPDGELHWTLMGTLMRTLMGTLMGTLMVSCIGP